MIDPKITDCVAIKDNVSGRVYVVSGYSDKTLEKLNYIVIKRGDCLQLDKEYEKENDWERNRNMG